MLCTLLNFAHYSKQLLYRYCVHFYYLFLCQSPDAIVVLSQAWEMLDSNLGPQVITDWLAYSEAPDYTKLFILFPVF
jgi:hypothetical protein